MRLARKLFVLAAAVLVGLMLTVATASAQLEISEEHGFGDNAPCPTLDKVGHVVTGGCHFELETEQHIALAVQTAGGTVVLANCNVHIEGRASGGGTGWITEAALTPEEPPANPSCTRAPCDEANGTQIPWPIVLAETGAGVETVELTFCLRTIVSGPGGAGTSCEVHMPLSDNGGHQFEIGDTSTYFCENQPSVSIRNVHCINEIQGPGEAKEDVEVVH